MVRTLLAISLVIGVIALSMGALLNLGGPATASHAGGADAISIDLDTTGNSALAIGPVDSCVVASAGDTITFDVTIDTVPPYVDSATVPGVVDPTDSGGILSYSFELNYPAGGDFTLSAVTDKIMVVAGAGSSVFSSSDFPPDTDGLFTVGGLETSISPAAVEDGNGTLASITMAIDGATPSGVYDLTLTNAAHADPGGFNLPDALNDAQVAVGTTCPLPPTPTPSPSPSPSPSPTPVPLTDVQMDNTSMDIVEPGNMNSLLTAPTGVDFRVWSKAFATNNGPSNADVEITHTLVLPPDCTATSSNPVVEALDNQAPGGIGTGDVFFTVSCTDPSDHQFTVSVTLEVTGLATDTNLSNNGPLNRHDSIAITAQTDVKVTSVTVNAPDTAAVGGAFDVTAQITVHNNGPVTPAFADAALTLNLPAGCTTGDTNPATQNDVSLAQSVPEVSPPLIWSVTCTTFGSKVFTASGSATLDQLHVSDSNGGNDSLESTSDSTTITSAADLKVSGVTVNAPDIAVEAGQNFIVSVSGTIHNNGPEATTYSQTIDLSVPGDCTAIVADDIVGNGIGLAPSAPVQVGKAWTVNCSDPSTHQFDGSVSVTVTDPNLSDPNLNNNSMNNNDTTAVIGATDVKVSFVTVDAPASAPAGVPFPVVITATVHNNGPVTPVDADVLFSPGQLPADCGAPEPNDLTQTISLVQSTATNVQVTLDVTCSDPSNHQFDASASVSVESLHVDDSNSGNDDGSGSDTTAVIGEADLQINLWSESAPGSADAGVPFDVSVTSSATSSGPQATDAEATIDLTLPPDCRYDDDSPFPHVQTVTVTPFNTVSPSPKLTASVVCDNPSNHDFVFNASIVPTTLHIQDSNAANDSDQKTATTAILAETDLKVTNVDIIVSPTAATDIPFDVTVEATVHNNGPTDVTSADVVADLTVDTNCTKDPNNTQSTSLPLAASATTQVSHNWTVTCTEVEAVGLAAGASISVDQLHVSDSNDGNDSSGDETSVDVTKPKFADIKVTALDVDAPAEVEPGENFLVTVAATVHNNGPAAQIFALVALDLGVPNDCVAELLLFDEQESVIGELLLNLSASIDVSETWTVVCSDTSFHNFTGFARAFIATEGVSDPNISNNNLSQGATTVVSASADLKVTSVSIDTPGNASGVGTFDVDITAVVHNNGPFTPADAKVTLDLDLPSACSATTPTSVEVAASLVTSVATPIDHSWSVTCSAPGTIAIHATIVSTDQHQIDGDDSNNSLGASSTPTPPTPPTTAPPTTPPETTPPTEPPAPTPTPTPAPSTPPPLTEPPVATPTPSPVVLRETATPEPSPEPSSDVDPTSPTPAVFPPTGGEPLGTNGVALGLLLLLGGVLVAGGAWMAWKNQSQI